MTLSLCLEVVLLNQVAVLLLTLLGAAMLFSTTAVPVQLGLVVLPRQAPIPWVSAWHPSFPSLTPLFALFQDTRHLLILISQDMILGGSLSHVQLSKLQPLGVLGLSGTLQTF